MKLPVWATVFTLCGMMVLCALGAWQLDRLAWKEDLLASIDREYAKDPMQFPLGVEDFQTPEGLSRGFLEGVFLNEKEIALQARIRDGRLGVNVITPFLPEGAQDYVLVNRGWVPIEQERKPSDVVFQPEGVVKIIGMARLPQPRNWFTPPNKPDEKQWYSIEADAVFLSLGLKGAGPKIFYQEGESKPGLYPAPQQEKIAINNNHLQYALFWFGMAFVLLTIYVIRFLIKPMK